MLIKNTESLKEWLVVVLEPLCDADSSALARYVLALLKKDKPEKELKRVMIEQLDVFLADETKPFVEKLFEAINNEEYLKSSHSTSSNLSNIDKKTTTVNNNNVDTVIMLPTVPSVNVKDVHMMQPVIDIRSGSKQENGEAVRHTVASKSRHFTTVSIGKDVTDKNRTPPIEDGKVKNVENDGNTFTLVEHYAPSHHQSATSQHQQKQLHSKCVVTPQVYTNVSGAERNQQHRSASPPPMARTNVADKENQPRESRRRRTSLRSRSRSRSNDRLSRRSRSRDRRANEREKSQRQFRNKSPPNGCGNDNRHDRRRGGGNRRMVVANNITANTNIEDKSPRLVNDRKGVTVGGSARPTNRPSNSPRSRSPSQEHSTRNKRSPSVGRSQAKGPFNNSTDTSPGSRHHHNEISKRQRCRDFDEKGYCVRGETCPWDHGVNPVVFEGINNSALISMSLREYNPDAPDLWTRNAPPPPIATGTAGSSLLTGTTTSAINPFTGAVRPAGVMMSGHVGHVTFPQVPGTEKSTPGTANLPPAAYARNAVSIFRPAAPMMPFTFNPNIPTPLQRELIPVPVVDVNNSGNNAGGDVAISMQCPNKRRFELEDSVAIAESPSKRKIPAHSRLGPRLPSLQNCSLELRKVPRGLNSIAHLNNHFAKFGKIVNIQISYDNDPEAAIVTFSTHAEANVAYRSTEAVLNNRFIKVFWHSAPSTESVVSGDGNTILGGAHNNARKNNQYHVNNVPAVIPTTITDSAKTVNTSQSQTADANNNANSNSNAPCSNTTTISSNTNSQQDAISATTATTATTTITTTTTTTATMVVAATHVQPPSLRLKNNTTPRSGGITNAIIRKKQEEQVKAVVHLANGLRKRKQELLQSYVKQMKSALELVERCEPSDPQRSKTLDTINVLQKTIDKLRKEIATEQEQMQAQIQNQQPSAVTVKKTKEQQKKELLDIELELFAQQQEGNDTTAIQKRLEELQRSLGIVPGNSSPTATLPTTGNLNTKTSHFITSGRANSRLRASFLEGSTRVDRRPKTIIITEFNSEEADSVLTHFKHFGEITKHDIDLEKPQLIVSYATRTNAEQALSRGKMYKDKRLHIIWAPIIQTTTNASGVSNASNKATLSIQQQQIDPTEGDAVKNTNKTKNIGSGFLWPPGFASPTYSPITNEIESNNAESDILPELRLDEEEEEEESEDRSWRR